LRQNITDAVDLTDKNMPAYMFMLKVILRKGVTKSDTKAMQMLFDKTNGLASILDEKQREATEADKAILRALREDAEKWLPGSVQP
jgi:hypothetical protein